MSGWLLIVTRPGEREASLKYGNPEPGWGTRPATAHSSPPRCAIHILLTFPLAWAAGQVYHASRAVTPVHVPAPHMPILLAWGRGPGRPGGGTVRALRGAVQRCCNDSTTTNIHVASLRAGRDAPCNAWLVQGEGGDDKTAVVRQAAGSGLSPVDALSLAGSFHQASPSPPSPLAWPSPPG